MSVRVLLIEDHSDTRHVLELLLKRCGFQTVTAKNAKDARARLAEMDFDIFVSDLNLPDGDGIDLVREAKQLRNLKTIAVTARTSAEERERGLRAGFDVYLTKPIDFRELRCAMGVTEGRPARPS